MIEPHTCIAYWNRRKRAYLPNTASTFELACEYGGWDLAPTADPDVCRARSRRTGRLLDIELRRVTLIADTDGTRNWSWLHFKDHDRVVF